MSLRIIPALWKCITEFLTCQLLNISSCHYYPPHFRIRATNRNLLLTSGVIWLKAHVRLGLIRVIKSYIVRYIQNDINIPKQIGLWSWNLQ